MGHYETFIRKVLNVETAISRGSSVLKESSQDNKECNQMRTLDPTARPSVLNE